MTVGTAKGITACVTGVVSKSSVLSVFIISPFFLPQKWKNRHAKKNVTDFQKPIYTADLLKEKSRYRKG